MRTLRILPALSAILSLTGCIGIQPLSYFEVRPFARPLPPTFDGRMTLVMTENIPDSFMVEGEGLRKMKVTDFRLSLAASMLNALERNFDVVNIATTQPDSGLCLVIYRVKPFWNINGQSSSAVGTDGIVYSTSTTLISAAFRFESSLYLHGKKLQDADETVYSDDLMSSATQAHPVFKNGLTKTCEVMIRELFKGDELVQQ